MFEEMFRTFFPYAGIPYLVMIALISAVTAGIGAMFIVWPLVSASLGDVRKKNN